MTDIEQARKTWLLERAKYETFGQLLEKRLGSGVQAKGVWCETQSRAKESHSLIKKLLKGKHSYATLPDKVGVRCIVRFLSDVEVAVSTALGLFDCSHADRKIEELGADRVGYLSVHMEARLRPSDPNIENYPPNQFWAELQLRTLAQHLWAEMSHDSVYKSDEALAKLPADIRRRVSLMAGVIEVADREFERLNQELTVTPEVQLYKALERQYYKFSSKRPDAELSIEVIALLVPLYNSDVPTITGVLEKFVNDHEAVLHTVYAEAPEAGVSAFLYQPEVLMIYERLEIDQLAARKAWNTRFPETELERVANTFGISFD